MFELNGKIMFVVDILIRNSKPGNGANLFNNGETQTGAFGRLVFFIKPLKDHVII